MKYVPYILSVLLFQYMAIASATASRWDGQDFKALSIDIVHGEATMEGVFQVKCLPAAALVGLLPTGLILKKTDLCDYGFHPALFFFGVQKNLRAVTKNGFIPFSKEYSESIMGIFSVTHKNAAERFFYVSQIKVDSTAAWLFAQPYGGLNKHLSIIKTEEGKQTLFSKDGKTQLASAGWVNLDAVDENKIVFNFSKIKNYFTDRVIAKRGSGFTCFGFNWNFQIGKMKPSQLQMKLNDEYVSHMLSGVYSDKLSLEQSPLGAFYSSNSWAMQLPQSCQ